MRRGNTLTYSRAVTLLTERPVDLDRAVVQADLRFTDPAGGAAPTTRRHLARPTASATPWTPPPPCASPFPCRRAAAP
ncbi:hypothetical protein [Deinococcus multiflagellatus]|uniref:Uncharacterized protein n=1 Tax=Deinococcus multiflagellatus TaxID=1656887 RepID=A0ABW1ZMK5_9DEIO